MPATEWECSRFYIGADSRKGDVARTDGVRIGDRQDAFFDRRSAGEAVRTGKHERALVLFRERIPVPAGNERSIAATVGQFDVDVEEVRHIGQGKRTVSVT